MPPPLYYLILLALAASSYAAPTKNPRKPKPFERHIVAVGDLHGDFKSFYKVLRFSGVLDAKNEWSDGVDVFVQTGDIIDRCDCSFSNTTASNVFTAEVRISSTFMR